MEAAVASGFEVDGNGKVTTLVAAKRSRIIHDNKASASLKLLRVRSPESSRP